jgi:hypothetical protein
MMEYSWATSGFTELQEDDLTDNIAFIAQVEDNVEYVYSEQYEECLG